MLLGAGLALGTGCSCQGLGLSPQTRFRCQPDGTCAAGYVCDGRYCISLDNPVCADGGCNQYLHELDCADGVDDDSDRRVDCEDSDCEGQPCSTNDPCTVGELCASGACFGGTPVQCTTPPGPCFRGRGSCNREDGGCSYLPENPGVQCGGGQVCGLDGGCFPDETGELCKNHLDDDGDGRTDCQDDPCVSQACDDGSLCTLSAVCLPSFVCAYQSRVECKTPPGPCYADAGSCQESDGNCHYAFLPAGVGCDAGYVCGRTGGCFQREVQALCTNTLDDDDDGLSDCADPDCLGWACDDNSLCTVGETCTPGGVCGNGKSPCNPCIGSGACNPQTGCNTTGVNAWARCDGGVCRLDGGCGTCPSGWCTAESPLPSLNLTSVWGTSSTQVWAVGSGSILRFDGVRWSVQESHPGEDYEAVWARNPTDAWAVGHTGSPDYLSIVRRWNGATWNLVAPAVDGGLYSVWGDPAGKVWAGGPDGVIQEWSGTTWSNTKNGGGGCATTNGLWGPSATDVWAVMSCCYFVHNTGGAWGFYSFPGASCGGAPDPNSMFLGIHGTGPGNAWAVGWNGAILRLVGSDWTHVWGGGPAGKTLQGVWAESASNAWAVGYGGSVVHWDGGSWTEVDVGRSSTLNAVWGANRSDVWAVGNGGVLLRLQPDAG